MRSAPATHGRGRTIASVRAEGQGSTCAARCMRPEVGRVATSPLRREARTQRSRTAIVLERSTSQRDCEFILVPDQRREPALLLGAGITPAEGSLKPTAGFISISSQYSINRDRARAVYSTSGITRS